MNSVHLMHANGKIMPSNIKLECVGVFTMHPFDDLNFSSHPFEMYTVLYVDW